MRTKKLLDQSRRKSVLIDRVGDGQRLPAVHINGQRAGDAGDQRQIDRAVTALFDRIISVGVGLTGTVREEVSRNRRIDTVAHPGRGHGVQRDVVGVITQRDHLEAERREGVGGAFGIGIPLFQDAEGGVTNRFPPGHCQVRGGVFAVVEVTHGRRVIGGPRIVHGNRQAEEVAGLHRGMRGVDPDGGKVGLVPDPRDALGGEGRIGGGGEGCEKDGQTQED